MTRMLAFTPEVFLSLFEQYNAAIWPAQVVAYVLGLLAVFLTLRPGRGTGRLIAAILAGFWLWIGVAYHLMFFAAKPEVDPSAHHARPGEQHALDDENDAEQDGSQ